jgi:hypothetical protein
MVRIESRHVLINASLYNSVGATVGVCKGSDNYVSERISELLMGAAEGIYIGRMCGGDECKTFKIAVRR